MKAGIGELPEVPPKTFVANISSVNQHNLCDQRWYHERVDNRIRPMEETDFLATGRLGHEAVEDLHNRMGEWDTDAALGIANHHAERMRQNVEDRGHLMTEKEREKRKWFADWLPVALSTYAQKYRKTPWTRTLATEEAVWLLLDLEDVEALGSVQAAALLKEAGYAHIAIVGRPDAVVERRGQLWHVQRKFFSPQVDLLEFVKKAPFQRHEIFYLTALEALSQMGEYDGLPIGYTLFDLIRKVERPQHPSELSPPKKCKCGAADIDNDPLPENEDDFPSEQWLQLLAAHPKMAKERVHEHWAEERAKQQRFRDSLVTKQNAYDLWLERTFLQHDGIVTKRQRARIFGLLLYDIATMSAKKEGLLLTTPREGWACNAFFRRCPYIDICAGRASVDGPQFADRKNDYTDIPEELT